MAAGRADNISLGENKEGAIAATGETNTYTFTANAQDTIVVRCGQLAGTSSFNPWIQLYGPNGALLTQDQNASDAYCTAQVTQNGTYSVVVGSYVRGQTGTYRLRVMKVPGEFVVPPGDEGGSLTNGANYDGTIDMGDEDIWRFSAHAGDSIVVRCGELSGTAAFNPYLRLYAPNGSLVDQDQNASDAYISAKATLEGDYTVLVGSYNRGQTGTYRLRLMKAPGDFVISPGDEGGSLTNGANYNGTIEIGDEDIWKFSAHAGDSIVVRCGELSGTASLNPYLRLYGPNGTLVTQDQNSSDAYVEAQATLDGDYTVLVGSYVRGQTGTYRLRMMKAPGDFVVSPGDEGGSLTNGANYDGTIDMGDVDIWKFSAHAGDSIVVRCGEVSGTAAFNPYLRLYGPNGTLVTQDQNANDAYVSAQATLEGDYTVLISSYVRGQTGAYRLRFMQAPGEFIVPAGDEGGSMVKNANHDGRIEIGDEDIWRFTACLGDDIILNCKETSGTASFNPHVRLYGPNGSLVSQAQDLDEVVIRARAASPGAYTVLVGSYVRGQTGTYRLTSNGLSDGLKFCLLNSFAPNLKLNVVGGKMNADYVICASTNAFAPANLWTPIRTNQCDQFGVFLIDQVFDPNLRQQYFYLRSP